MADAPTRVVISSRDQLPFILSQMPYTTEGRIEPEPGRQIRPGVPHGWSAARRLTDATAFSPADVMPLVRRA